MANSEIIGAGQDTARPAPKIIQGDCRNYLDIQFDVLITDPPYGLKKECKRQWHGGNGKSRLYGENKWDEKDFELLDLFVAKAKQVIIWGGNFYPLQPTDSWLIWDKLQDNRGSDAELAWAVLPKRGCRVFRMSRIDAYFNKRIFRKEHPHEKPIQLMEWCVKKTSGIILDPFMGCGSTLVAAMSLGRECIGIEKEEKYCRIAEERIHALRSPAQNTMEICHTAPNSAMLQGLKPHAGGTGTSA